MASLFKWWVIWFNGNLVGFLGSIGGSLRSFGWNEHFSFSTFLIMMKRWIGWTRCTFVDVFIVINFLEFFNANDFEEGVGHNAHHTKFIQNSHQFHLGGNWGVSSSYGPHHCSSHMNYNFFFQFFDFKKFENVSKKI